jgi:hypothetical protein
LLCLLTLITRFHYSRQIEDALAGRIYDPYIRLLLWEGVRSWWRDSLPTWLSCSRQSSDDKDDFTSGSFFTPSAGLDQLTFRAEADGSSSRKAVICPFAWASETHRTTCALGFPANYDDELLHNEGTVLLEELREDAGSSTMTGRLLEVGGQSPFYLKIRSTLLAFS